MKARLVMVVSSVFLTLAFVNPAHAAIQSADDLKKAIENDLKGTFTSIKCRYQSPADASKDKPTLTCDSKLLVSGEKVSDIQVIGLPTNTKVTVRVNVADENIIYNSQRQARNYSNDKMEAYNRDSVQVEVHHTRLVAPTYGGLFDTGSQREKIRATTDTERNLAVIATSGAQTLRVGVEVGVPGADGYQSASDSVQLVYEQWGFETGGFLAVSNLADSELVTAADPNDKTKQQVLKTRKADKLTEETGIFLSLIPRNYPYLGIGLGLATNSGHNPSVYLGPSVRLIGLGDRGLASFSVGVVERQVKEFPGATVNTSFASDSSVLKGTYHSKLGYYFLINLGFTFGQIGATDAKSSSGTQ